MLLSISVYRHLNLYAMATTKKEYDVNKGLLNGNQVNTLSSSMLIEEVQAKTSELLKEATDIYILHDPCDIRKPSAPKMEHIGKVLSLSKEVINGYKTFNSVAIDLAQQGIHLVSHNIYSTELPNYVSQEQLKDITQCTLEIQDLVAENKHVNTSVLYKKHIKESSEVVKRKNPTASVCHISDREFDCEDFFETIDNQGDKFITHLKLSRLSNERKEVLTAKGKLSKKVIYKKLVDKSFKNKGEYLIPRLEIKGKVYKNIRCVLEWEPCILNEKSYNVVRITLWGEHKPVFEHPMLLITNKVINNAEDAKIVYKGYILRFKIEVVFKFLKQNLGWETFQIRDFESIKNILAIGFFLIGYFKELEEELKRHPLALFLCKLAKSKGIITVFFLLEGLEKLIHFQEVQRWKEENNLTNEEINALIQQLKSPT